MRRWYNARVHVEGNAGYGTAMSKYKFNPPLRLAGIPNVFISSLDEAVTFMKGYTAARRPTAQRSVLRQLKDAISPMDQNEAAYAFRFWAEGEGLLIS